ncbi:PREDICTED: protein ACCUMULATION AND REPLICATION OF CHLOROPLASTS 3 [Populus euphratica]|uniref:Protein ACCUMULATION AND REPLICATION OF CHLOROPLASTS 3 n=1 Tax=Populus euphratica TaxID=75702 RepID=A0AAJ6U2Y3_POPEU|nr:PREDICTED: protein ACCUMULATION AND REPLICATION OF CHLOROPLASTS 3 [Populus euphratica]
MEVPVLTSFHSVSLSSKTAFYMDRCSFFRKRLNCKRRCRLRIKVSSEKDDDDGSLSFKSDAVNFCGGGQSGDLVDVISIGSRKDAVVDFCFDSPLQLSSSLLRFWNIQTKDSVNVQLQERVLEKDVNPRVMEVSQFLKFPSKAIVLVASAGYGLEHITAIDILKTRRFRNGFTVAIFLKPFSFEGQRRQDEVKDLVGKLQEYTNFCIDIDTDALLKKDLVTLDEALKSANSAVLLAINAISILISEMHQKIIDAVHNNVKELKVSEVIKILESYKEAKIGFGTGNSIRNSIIKALYDCPFIGAGVKELNGIVICIIASSVLMDDKDVHASLLTFRRTANYTGEIIICTAHEPNLEPNMLVTTVVIVGCIEQQAPQKSSIFSKLAQHFPFVFKLLRISHQKPCGNEGRDMEDAQLSKGIDSPDSGLVENISSAEGLVNGVDKHSKDSERVSGSDYVDIYSSRNYNNGVEEDGVGLLEEDMIESSNFYNQNMEETPAFQREPLISRNMGPGYQIAQEWAKERAGATPVLDDMSIFQLPVGVRPSEESKGSLNISYATELSEPKTEDDFQGQTLVNSNIPSWGDAGFVAVRDFYNNASTLLKGKNPDVLKKQGILSARAASMLEAERDSPKKWSPIMEMQYRGGVYRGRCQGGLPEGKGRLILQDRSMYDGMWRYGKRSGPGTFYFSNGDVFQGSWRDDVMHGKGWFYFHTGDRWFANFWKGKANGESRFYSKFGDVFFGHFQDGWRHGRFLCIDVDGARYVETWDEGVLVSREQLDSSNGGG